MTEKVKAVIYWDTSAILSVIFQDIHSPDATKQLGNADVHFISSLAYAEACAVISRMQHQQVLSDLLITACFDVLDRGPWRRILIDPDWESIKKLSEQWPLRGADLWHLTAAKKLREDFPELMLLTYDKKLESAIQGEHLT